MRIASMVGLTLLTTCSAWGQEWVYKADAPAGLATNLIYDSAQGVVKGFGSEASYAWDGVSWTADAREYLPTGHNGVAIVFDSYRDVTVGAFSLSTESRIFELIDHLWEPVAVVPTYARVQGRGVFDASTGMCTFFSDQERSFRWDGAFVIPPTFSIEDFTVVTSSLVADPIRNTVIQIRHGQIREFNLETRFASNIIAPQLHQIDFAMCWSTEAQATIIFGRHGVTGRITTWTWDGTRLLERLVDFPDTSADGKLIFDESRGVLVLVSSGKTYELASLPPAPAIISFTPALRNLRRGSTARLDVTTSNDADLAKVEIWRDVNSNNELDLGVDFKLGDTTRGANNRWTASLSTRNWPAGQQQLLAVAYEEFTNATSFLATPMTIVNSIPMLPGFTATPRRIATPLTPMTVTALRPTDVDGTVTRIDYFIDYDRSGARGANEPLFSTTNLTARLNVPTELLAYGFNQIVAHAVDNDGARSLPVRQRVYVNRPPVTTAFSATPSTISGSTATFTLSVTGTDVDGSITGAEFWWDVNNNGVIDSTVDRKIGTPRRVGTTNTWTSTQPRGTILTGQQRFIGRLIDNERVNSAPTSPVTVTFN